MFDIGAAELLVIAIAAILVIGPKDMPKALRTAGRWIGQVRRMSNHFRTGIDAMIREAEMEEMEKKWQERNAQIMREHPGDEPAIEQGTEMTPLPAPDSGSGNPAGPTRSDSAPDPDADDPVPEGAPPSAASAEARIADSKHNSEDTAEPQLPLGEDRPVHGDAASEGKG